MRDSRAPSGDSATPANPPSATPPGTHDGPPSASSPPINRSPSCDHAASPFPANASKIPLIVQDFQAAMYRLQDCLRRAGDGVNFNDLDHMVFGYVDKQLNLVEENAAMCRICLINLADEISRTAEKASGSNGQLPSGAFLNFPDAGPYQGGA
jgi:hypothetical protein